MRISSALNSELIKSWIDCQVLARKQLASLSKVGTTSIAYDGDILEMMLYDPYDLRHIAKILKLPIVIETFESQNYVGKVNLHYEGLHIYSFCYNYKELMGE